MVQTMAGLSPQQIKFCNELLTKPGLSEAQAYINAGYKVRTPNAAAVGASRLKNNKKIQEYLAERMQLATTAVDITVARVLQEYAAIAYSRITSICEFDAQRIRMKPSDQLEDSVVAAIAEVSETITEAGGAIKVKMHNKLAALKALERYLGMSSDLNQAIAVLRQYGIEFVRDATGLPIEMIHVAQSSKDADDDFFADVDNPTDTDPTDTDLEE